LSPFWRREKPLHEQLAEQAGMELPTAEPRRPRQPWDEVGIHGVHRQREWDAVVAVDASGPEGAELAFVALADGTILLESDAELPEDDVAPFTAAIEAQVEPPYRAIGIRRGPEQWALAARALQVIELEDDPGGDAIELSRHQGERTHVVDGTRSFGTIPELEDLLEGQDGVVRAQRIDGQLFEVEAAPL
jgi:hypothetical protein